MVRNSLSQWAEKQLNYVSLSFPNLFIFIIFTKFIFDTDKNYLKYLLTCIIIYEIMEISRFYGYYVYRYHRFKFGIIFLPIILGLLVIIIRKYNATRFMNAIHFCIFSFFLSLTIQLIYGEYSIISWVWYFIIGCSLCVTYYLQEFPEFNRLVNSLNFEKQIELIKFKTSALSEQCKFFLDRWAVMVAALGAVLATMMSILWQNPYNNDGLRTQKLYDALYMVIGYFSVVFITGRWIALPAFVSFQKCLLVIERK